jgi:hypothetical protein
VGCDQLRVGAHRKEGSTASLAEARGDVRTSPPLSREQGGGRRE